MLLPGAGPRMSVVLVLVLHWQVLEGLGQETLSARNERHAPKSLDLPSRSYLAGYCRSQVMLAVVAKFVVQGNVDATSLSGKSYRIHNSM